VSAGLPSCVGLGWPGLWFTSEGLVSASKFVTRMTWIHGGLPRRGGRDRFD